MSETIREAIEQAAVEPQSATVDGQSATARPIAELIAADRYTAARDVARARKPGLRLFTIAGNAPQ